MNSSKSDLDPGVTLVTAVKDRETFLERALPTWVNVRGVERIVVLDWGSAKSLVPITFPYGSRVQLYRMGQDIPWKLTLALNVASTLVKTDLMLKVDADTLLANDFLDTHPITKNCFYSGNWRISDEVNDQHLNGVLYCWTNEFRKIHGYHESLETYGWDDSDLYARLEKSLVRKDLKLEALYHLPHGDAIRLKHSKTRLDCAGNIERNRQIAEASPWYGPLTKPSSLEKKSRFTEVILDTLR